MERTRESPHSPIGQSRRYHLPRLSRSLINIKRKLTVNNCRNLKWVSKPTDNEENTLPFGHMLRKCGSLWSPCHISNRHVLLDEPLRNQHRLYGMGYSARIKHKQLSYTNGIRCVSSSTGIGEYTIHLDLFTSKVSIDSKIK